MSPMWHFISDQISEATGDVFICENAQRLGQQHFHESYVIKGSQRRYFVKVCDVDAHQFDVPSPLTSEYAGLSALLQHRAKFCPTPICHGFCDDRDRRMEYVVMRYIGFKSPSERLWQEAGTALAAMHKDSQQHNPLSPPDHYGWPTNNYLGSTLQCNQPSPKWSTFFITQRIEAFCRQLSGIQHGVDDKLLATAEYLLDEHQPPSCLLHGDLWQGNIGFTATMPLVFDPAVWMGDRECDLAMAKLFGGFAQLFFNAYEAHWPLPQHADTRVALYQLPHGLNHLLMFGESYTGMVRDLIQQVQKQSSAYH